jgi:16S rRNA (cytosine967-C5)-methyltransferase
LVKAVLRNAWTLAIEALSWVELRGWSGRLALSQTAEQLQISDRATLRIAHKLVKETLRRQNTIDRIINLVLAPNSLHNFRLGIRAFLKLYTYWMLFSKSASPQHASKIATLGRVILGWREMNKIEGVLGKITTININKIFIGLSDEEKVGLETFHPTWFVRYCFRLLGRAQALKFLRKSLEIPPTYIRINTLKGNEEDLVAKIGQAKIMLERVTGLRHLYRVLDSETPPVKTNAYAEGSFFIQDLASCLCVEVADPQPKMTVLDICAAPGAKTTYLAQIMENQGCIYSIDYSPRRTLILRRELSRMGVKIAYPIVADACRTLPIKVKADLVLLDPPCSSTGAFWKMPSAKWRVDLRAVRGLAKLQWMMLNACADLVKDGGSLVYSTCSITLEENEMLIERFLKWHPEFRLVDAKPKIGLPGLRGLFQCQRLYPHIHNTNGFFVAKLIREK